MRLLLFSFFFLCSFVTVALSASPDAKPVSAAPSKESSSLSASKKSEEIDLPAPVGEEMKGIVIPQYEADGKLRMKLSCDTAQKVDEHNVSIHGLKVEFFEKGERDVVVSVPEATFNLATTLLSTETPTTIKREDFSMVGDTATFDTTKRFGTMKGHVHTEIRNGTPKE